MKCDNKKALCTTDAESHWGRCLNKKVFSILRKDLKVFLVFVDALNNNLVFYLLNF